MSSNRSQSGSSPRKRSRSSHADTKLASALACSPTNGTAGQKVPRVERTQGKTSPRRSGSRSSSEGRASDGGSAQKGQHPPRPLSSSHIAEDHGGSKRSSGSLSARSESRNSTTTSSSSCSSTGVSSPSPSARPSSAKGGGGEETMSAEDTALLLLIKYILGNWREAGKRLNEDILRNILQRVRPILMSQPMLLRLQAPLNICGDIHGQITDLVEIFKAGGLPPNTRYLFLGDYVDRGKYGTEVITVLLGLKVLYPNQIHVLRGNHETDSICRIYGFFDEVKRRFTVRLFKEFVDVFNCLPVSALINEVALCMHGGLSPELRQLRQIDQISRPLIVADAGLACDLLWSDPEENSKGWQPSERGVSYTFGEDIVRRVCDTLDLDTIFRAHQVVDNGYAFFAGRRLVTIFSASNYCGEFTNSGAMMMMDKDCKCSFQIFKPQYH